MWRVLSMTRSSCVMLTVLSLLATPAAAQWLNYPTPGMPRTKDGKPNLAAPTPRATDGKPDLSGMWSNNGLGYATNITDVEMTPAAQAALKQRLESYGAGDPATNCLPEGPRSSLAGLGSHADCPDAEDGRCPVRGRKLPPDLHRRPPASQRSQPDVDGLLRRPLGRRHVRRADHRIQRQDVARLQRPPAQ